MDTVTPTSPVSAFRVSERAAARIAEIVAAQQADGVRKEPGAEAQPAADAPPSALRVAVLAGGCSGFQYRFDLEAAAQPDDLVVQQGAARVLVDPSSLDLLAGAQLDYVDELMGAHFTVRNPNATSACGCGTSFSVD